MGHLTYDTSHVTHETFADLADMFNVGLRFVEEWPNLSVKFRLQGGKFWPLYNMRHNLNMFLYV